jgi:hypothetical protein
LAGPRGAHEGAHDGEQTGDRSEGVHR